MTWGERLVGTPWFRRRGPLPAGDNGRVHYRVLGTTQALHDDGTPVSLGGARLRALLAVLALRAGRTVPVGILVDEVWAGDPPADAVGAVQALVGRLRRALGHAAVASADGGGYRLCADGEDADLHRFDRLAGEGARALEEGDSLKAAALLDDALALWQGPVLADLPDRTAEAARWEARRLDARRARLGAALALGRAEEVLPELVALCEEHAMDEPLQVLRIRALRDAGRGAQAPPPMSPELLQEARRGAALIRTIFMDTSSSGLAIFAGSADADGRSSDALAAPGDRGRGAGPWPAGAGAGRGPGARGGRRLAAVRPLRATAGAGEQGRFRGGRGRSRGRRLRLRVRRGRRPDHRGSRRPDLIPLQGQVFLRNLETASGAVTSVISAAQPSVIHTEWATGPPLIRFRAASARLDSGL
jgi:DNA-binding SARP family transcriptional activator